MPAVAAPGAAAQVLKTRYQGRLPNSLDELTGPAHGVVQLPAHVAWSGLTTYNLDGTRSCMTLYRTVLAEGQRDDLSGLLNRDLLLSRWPILRNLISRHIREVWESAFPELRDTFKTVARLSRHRMPLEPPQSQKRSDPATLRR